MIFEGFFYWCGVCFCVMMSIGIVAGIVTSFINYRYSKQKENDRKRWVPSGDHSE